METSYGSTPFNSPSFRIAKSPDFRSLPPLDAEFLPNAAVGDAALPDSRNEFDGNPVPQLSDASSSLLVQLKGMVVCPRPKKMRPSDIPKYLKGPIRFCADKVVHRNTLRILARRYIRNTGDGLYQPQPQSGILWSPSHSIGSLSDGIRCITLCDEREKVHENMENLKEAIDSNI